MVNTVWQMTAGGMALVITTFAVVSCAAGDAELNSAEGSPVESEAAASVSISNLRNAFSGVSFDYEVYSSPAEVAEISEIVAYGTPVKVMEGPTYGDFKDDMADIRTVLVEFELGEVLQGEPRDERIGVQFFADAGTTIEAFEAAFPSGTEALIYAESIQPPTVESSGEIDVDNWEAVEQAAVPLYRPIVQGFAVEVGLEETYWPLTDVEREVPLVEAEPAGTEVGVE